MNRAAALVGLLALAACGGGAGSAPETVAKGVDIEAELAALRSTTPSHRDVGFWTAEGDAFSALWARALAACYFADDDYFERDGPAVPNCEAVLRAAKSLATAHVRRWQQHFSYDAGRGFNDRSSVANTYSRGELFAALASDAAHPLFANAAYWTTEARSASPLWADAFHYCATKAPPGKNPNCVALLIAASHLYASETYSGWVQRQRRESSPR